MKSATSPSGTTANFLQAVEPSRRTTRRGGLVVFACLAMLTAAVLPLQAQAPAGDLRISQDYDHRTITIQWPGGPGTQSSRIVIDDCPAFRTPVYSSTVQTNSVTLGLLDAGLAPGAPYYVRVESANKAGPERTATFRVAVPTWQQPSYLDYAYARTAWETAGRAWMYRYGGLQWNDSSRSWEADAKWPYQSTAGPQAYYLEQGSRGAITMGLAAHDLPLLDELAKFYLRYYQTRYTTLGELRRRRSVGADTSLLNPLGKDSARVLSWQEKNPQGERTREDTLSEAQFYHGPARLIRVITLLPKTERTQAMNSFVGTYSDLILHDHLLRLLYEAHWNYWNAQDLQDKRLIDAWRVIRDSPRSKPSYHHSFQDRDLWLLGAAAEMLGANANDPDAVRMDSSEVQKLRDAIQLGVETLQTKRVVYTDTRTPSGQVVQSASYFNGDFDDHEDLGYSGYEGESYPTPDQKRTHPGTSWDVSHFYRVPVFFRTMYDNRKATGVDFPSSKDLQLLVNQLVYRVFQGDWNRPLLNNYFDGGNGWVRVGYHAGEFGIPPAQYCDAHNPQRPCLVAGSIQGWPLLAFVSADLEHLEHAYVGLAANDDGSARAFKDRYYFYNNAQFSARGSGGVPTLLYWVVSDMAPWLRGTTPR